MSLKLSDPSLLEERAFVGGEWSEGATRFPVVNPATGEEIARVANLGASDVRTAIDSAYEAQKSWRSLTAKERCGILLAWQQLMLDNVEDLAQILTAEMGKPLAEARGEIAYGASFIQWFAEEARRIYGDVIPGHQGDKRIIVLKQPIGVVGSITPWNFPNAMIARKVGPALASGCAFVGRPAEKTPLSALAMAKLAERAGVPKGVLSIVTGSDSKGMGLELCTNPKVRKVTFTGSTEVGRILMKQCAHDIKKLSLELGGNAPFIVFDDADLDKAVEGALIAKYRNSGQTCVCANRIYIQSGVLEAFSKKLVAATNALKVGDGTADGVAIGPLIDKAALDKVEEHVADAVAQGAKVIAGGKRSALGGSFYEPTVMTGVRPGMKILTEETFGPVAPLISFDTIDEAIDLANDTEFGLAAYFYSRDLSTVWKVAEGLESGMVGINTGLISTAEAPFGGIKSSGLGREGSKYGIDEFLEIKYLCMSVA
ncbi:MAG: NAD-dependent succinate-semialdehyde dehydrogenase [Alphaproteobacteria bacterium]|nr:NAD-dependent succinate-semialdehyde dehydrogenase [Alphaproteobacteria bacterium]MBU0804223.1 NAD-dependent succinate-semialdehyde dehydrogenase [Alphaproteobacteria bacterium]MBU0871054.1 NAD-dependent succinate-semialdehyde dehydrogenase [Alphaproteobacteria bacterium]MBU1400809.1 NAD-dependent succinate-semialdehyde dehydrogenase [Alphaproteobacteria bacterium]MBU1592774.1 NAD-dependent succinate-semialdehyde dehydrogenase [Alphaproteobacteria bacterium]